MVIDIINKDDTVSWEEIARLLHDSFQERLVQGMNFTCSFFTAEELERSSRGCSVLVALDRVANDYLAGTVTFELQSESRAYHSNLAVAPDYKNKGIATLLLKSFVALAENKGCTYIISDTAQNATSSIIWHLKNGFIPIRLRSFPSTNYYSIVFRKQLKKHWFWSNETFCRIHFALSSALCPLYRHEDGSLTVIGKLIDRLR